MAFQVDTYELDFSFNETMYRKVDGGATGPHSDPFWPMCLLVNGRILLRTINGHCSIIMIIGLLMTCLPSS